MITIFFKEVSINSLQPAVNSVLALYVDHVRCLPRVDHLVEDNIDCTEEKQRRQEFVLHIAASLCILQRLTCHLYSTLVHLYMACTEVN